MQKNNIGHTTLLIVHTNNHKGTFTKLGNKKDLDMRKTRNKKTFKEQTLKKGGQ